MNLHYICLEQAFVKKIALQFVSYRKTLLLILDFSRKDLNNLCHSKSYCTVNYVLKKNITLTSNEQNVIITIENAIELLLRSHKQ
jgi:hypothetical protein